MSDVTEALTKKIGPLPGWMYAVILAGGILGYRHFHPTTTVAPAASVDTTTQTAPAATTPPAPPIAPTLTVDPNSGQLSPADWAAQVSQYLNASTPYSSADINTAMTNFMNNSSQQTSQLQNIIDHATSAFTPPAQIIDHATSAFTPPAQIIEAQNSLSQAINAVSQTQQAIMDFQNSYSSATQNAAQAPAQNVLSAPNPNLPFIPGTFTPLHYATGVTTAPAAAAAGIQMGNVPQTVPHGAVL